MATHARRPGRRPGGVVHKLRLKGKGHLHELIKHRELELLRLKELREPAMQLGELRRHAVFNACQLGSRALPVNGLAKRKAVVVREAHARLIGCGFGGIK